MIVGMTDQAFESTVSGAFDAFNARRFDAFAEYVTEDLVESYPQSGERLEGKRSNGRPSFPCPAPHRCQGGAVAHEHVSHPKPRLALAGPSCAGLLPLNSRTRAS